MDTHPLEENFGERLRLERRRLGLTQEELADKMKVRPQTIYQYEKGKTSPSLPFVYALQSLDFNLQYLLLGKNTLPYSRDYPPEVIQYVVDAVTQFEKQVVGEPLSNETKIRMMLVLLGRYIDEPATQPASDAVPLSALAKS